MILQCGQPLHCWSDALKSALAQSRKIAILKIWSQCLLLFLQSYLENFLCHQAACLWSQLTIYRWFVDILPRYDLFVWLVPEKIAFCLQLSGSKYRYFIWAKRRTARRSVMVHSFAGQKIANHLQFFYFFKTWNFNPSFNQTYLTASFHRFGVLAKAM